jgi:hypothetical protein
MNKHLIIDCIPFEFSKSSINESVQDPSKPFTVKGVLQRAEAKNQNGRVYPYEVLVREAQKYADEFIKERRALGELDHPECCLSGCDILTYNGWKDIKDISPDEKIFTLNPHTKQIELQNIFKKIDEPYNGILYHIKGKNIDVEASPNHRFLVYDRHNNPMFITAEEIYELSKKINCLHLSIPKTGNWGGNSYDDNKFIINPLPESGILSSRTTADWRKTQSNQLVLNAKSFFGFLGFYLAEGHCNTRENSYGYSIFISQKKEENVVKFRTLLQQMSSELKWSETKNESTGCTTFYLSDARLWSYLNKLGNKYNKFIPQEIKNASSDLLEELFDWYTLGDGTIVNDGGYDRQSVFTVSEKLINDLHEILIKIGGSGRIKIQESPKDYVFAGRVIEIANKSPLYRLWVEKSKSIHLDFRFLSIEPIEYSGRIYCVSVLNETFYCRRNGKSFWSGNSVVNLRNASHNIIEMHWEGKDLVGTIEILPTPSGNILKELFKANIRLGISSRGMGSVEKDVRENVDVVQDDFEIICWDFVSNPSVKGSFMYQLNEGYVKNPINNKWSRTEELVREILFSVE